MRSSPTPNTQASRGRARFGVIIVADRASVRSAETAEMFGIDPRVAMLSYSTMGSGVGQDVDKVEAALAILQDWGGLALLDYDGDGDTDCEDSDCDLFARCMDEICDNTIDDNANGAAEAALQADRSAAAHAAAARSHAACSTGPRSRWPRRAAG